MPACQAARSSEQKKSGRERSMTISACRGQCSRLAGDSRDHEQERQSEREPPEAGGDRSDVRQAHHPRPEGERDIAEQQCRKGEADEDRRVAHRVALRDSARGETRDVELQP